MAKACRTARLDISAFQADGCEARQSDRENPGGTVLDSDDTGSGIEGNTKPNARRLGV
jgi:hypothetical protein